MAKTYVKVADPAFIPLETHYGSSETKELKLVPCWNSKISHTYLTPYHAVNNARLPGKKICQITGQLRNNRYIFT